MVFKTGKKKLRNENCVKFLGVLLDSSLSWTDHIVELSKKLAGTVGIFLLSETSYSLGDFESYLLLIVLIFVFPVESLSGA